MGEELKEAADKLKAASALADAAIAAEEQEGQEEDAGDCDDPFAMMGGMGAEEVYEVKMLKEKTPEELKEAADKLKAASALADAAIAAEEQEGQEEEEAADKLKAASVLADAAIAAEE